MRALIDELFFVLGAMYPDPVAVLLCPHVLHAALGGLFTALGTLRARLYERNLKNGTLDILPDKPIIALQLL